MNHTQFAGHNHRVNGVLALLIRPSRGYASSAVFRNVLWYCQNIRLFLAPGLGGMA